MPPHRHAAGLAGLLTLASGALAQAANTLMSCQDLRVDCADAGAGRTMGAAANDNAYAMGFVDVTQVVRAAGGGDYAIADLQAATGEDRHAGWSLIVAYRDRAQPVRNLSVVDGLQTVSPDRPGVTVPVSGFLTPSAGAVRTKVGFVVYEGDRGSVDAGARLDGTPPADGRKTADNVFGSTIADAGQVAQPIR
jgi:hypothetical protein